MSNLYNLCKDLVRKESYFEISSILEDLFKIKHDHEIIEYQVDNKITLFHRFYHDLVKEVFPDRISYKLLGKQHRTDGPASIEYYPDGSIRFKSWYQDGKFHKLNDPAIISYYPNGGVRDKLWMRHGKLHREDGSAVIHYHPDGSIKSESWYQYGEYHRVDGPAVIDYYFNGSIRSELWYQHGFLCRKDGPTFVHYG